MARLIDRCCPEIGQVFSCSCSYPKWTRPARGPHISTSPYPVLSNGWPSIIKVPTQVCESARSKDTNPDISNNYFKQLTSIQAMQNKLSLPSLYELAKDLRKLLGQLGREITTGRESIGGSRNRKI